MKIPVAFLGGGSLSLGGVPSLSGIEPAKIDLSRYMGTWRVIGCTDNPVEKKFVDATESYFLHGDQVQVVFKWREERLDAPLKSHEFKGRVTKHPTHAVWKMKLLPLFAATYIVVETASDYSWAVVAHPSKKFGWLLARERTLPEEIWLQALNKFGSLGYDTSRFIKVLQPE